MGQFKTNSYSKYKHKQQDVSTTDCTGCAQGTCYVGTGSSCSQHQAFLSICRKSHTTSTRPVSCEREVTALCCRESPPEALNLDPRAARTRLPSNSTDTQVRVSGWVVSVRKYKKMLITHCKMLFVGNLKQLLFIIR